MLETAKIDSLKLRIPKNKVTYVDPTFAEKYQKLYPGGLIADEINMDNHKVNETNGIKSKIMVSYIMESGGVTEEKIVIFINAKQLRERYFEGVTLLNAKTVYQYIIDLKIVSLGQ